METKNKAKVILQARMGSSRLPGKVLKKLGNHSSLYYQFERIKKSNWIDQVIVATTQDVGDEEIVRECEKIGIRCFRGPTQDVLARYYHCAKEMNLSSFPIVRITGDCPLIDFRVIDSVIESYFSNSCHYSSNVRPATFPDGMDVEVMSYSILERAFLNARNEFEREHVTPWIFEYLKNNPSLWSNVEAPQNYSKYRLTLDQLEDFEVISHLVNKFDGNASYIDYVNYLEKNLNWVAKNEKFRAR